ncbi:hypothetical protein K501DRAFT_267403 [Backusella circina FSU 941]|nr:hypothetical protein K501DRAFT_267403 [Backusella circina FSU 941]
MQHIFNRFWILLYKLRERGRMIPCFDESFEKQRQKVRATGGQKTSDDVKTINFSGLVYIIGLDFGTTYSGFAYAEARHCANPGADHNIVIKVVKTWPKQNHNDFFKVPSALYFDEHMKYLRKFGEAAKSASQIPKSTGILLRHFKLLLAREFGPILDDEILNTLEDFQIIDAIIYYLRDFNNAGINRLKRLENIKGSVKDLNLGYIITIPSMWCDEAKNTMRVAVQKAGLVSEKDINTKVHFITEAEAAAMYCEKFYDNQFSMERDQRFMICDAGGGTVDLVTFKVSQEKKNGNKFIISELTSGDGDTCGAIFIDRAFEKYIVDKFPRMVSEGFTRYSYGLQVKDRFQDSHDDPEQKIDGYDGNKYCQNVFSTIVGRDVTLKKGRVYVQRVFVTYPNDPVFAIYSNKNADTPRLTTNLNEYIMKVSAKMPKLDHKKDGDKVAFDVWFKITGRYKRRDLP